MAKNTGMKIVATALVFAFAIGITALVLGSISVAQNAKDDEYDIDSVTLSGHFDSTGNESLVAKVWSDDHMVHLEVKSWNGTCISTGDVYLTSTFVIPDHYLPKNFNDTTAEAFITPTFPVFTFVAGSNYRSTGYAFVNPDGKLAVYRDASNATATWAFASVRCQIYPFSGAWGRSFTINYR